MSFSKHSDLEPKIFYTSNFAIKEIEDRTMIYKRQNFENKAFEMSLRT